MILVRLILWCKVGFMVEWVFGIIMFFSFSIEKGWVILLVGKISCIVIIIKIVLYFL